MFRSPYAEIEAQSRTGLSETMASPYKAEPVANPYPELQEASTSRAPASNLGIFPGPRDPSILSSSDVDSSMIRVGRLTGRLCGEFRLRARDRFNELTWRTRELANSARTRTHEIQEERPLQMLAAIAAAAFGVGILLRSWRSHQS